MSTQWFFGSLASRPVWNSIFPGAVAFATTDVPRKTYVAIS